MSEDKVVELVEGALNPETFDVLSYLDEVPVASDSVDIYVDVASSKRLEKLLQQRADEIQKRRAAAQRGEGPALALDEADDDTEFDEEINTLVNSLEQTKLTFHLKSVAPSLEKAIKKSYVAKADRDATAEEKAEYEDLMYSDILVRAIDHVETGTGQRDDTEWDPKRLRSLRDRLYEPQMAKLLQALTEMVYVGEVFDGHLQ